MHTNYLGNNEKKRCIQVSSELQSNAFRRWLIKSPASELRDLTLPAACDSRGELDDHRWMGPLIL